MKKFLVLLSLLAILFIGCSKNTIVFPPLTTEAVEMGRISSDQVLITSTGSAVQTASLGNGPLNFLDRDSTIISFYYKGTPGNTADYQMQVFDSTSNGLTSIYTFRDNLITDSLKYVNVILPSHRVHASYFYSLKCSGTGAQSFYIENLLLYKK